MIELTSPAKELKRRRQQLGISQFQLATKARIAYSRLTFAETARCKLTADEIERIEAVFHKLTVQIVMDGLSTPGMKKAWAESAKS